MGKRTILTARRAVRRLLLTNEPLITPHLRCYQHSQKPIQKILFLTFNFRPQQYTSRAFKLQQVIFVALYGSYFCDFTIQVPIEVKRGTL